jgi:predicted unusual protein kinase regulating ubiquinone biosynthesis (AarF/ABC1/UbiB family)
MEYIDGSTLARLADLRRFGGPAAVDRALPGVDLASAFHILAFATFRRMFDHGRFHADLHPGNIILAPDGGVGIVDHGVVGRLTPRQRELAEAYYGQLAIGNVAATVACLSQLWTPADGADAGGFENDLKRIVRDWRRLITTPGAPVEAAHWGRFSDQVFAAARLRGYTADLGLVLFFRAIAQLHSCFILFSLDFVRELQAFMQPRQLTWRGPDGSLEASLDWIRKEVDAQRRTVGQVAALAAAPPPLVQAAARRSERQVRDETRRAKVLTLSLITVSVAVALSGRLA